MGLTNYWNEQMDEDSPRMPLEDSAPNPPLRLQGSPAELLSAALKGADAPAAPAQKPAEKSGTMPMQSDSEGEGTAQAQADGGGGGPSMPVEEGFDWDGIAESLGGAAATAGKFAAGFFLPGLGQGMIAGQRHRAEMDEHKQRVADNKLALRMNNLKVRQAEDLEGKRALVELYDTDGGLDDEQLQNPYLRRYFGLGDEDRVRAARQTNGDLVIERFNPQLVDPATGAATPGWQPYDPGAAMGQSRPAVLTKAMVDHIRMKIDPEWQRKNLESEAAAAERTLVESQRAIYHTRNEVLLDRAQGELARMPREQALAQIDQQMALNQAAIKLFSSYRQMERAPVEEVTKDIASEREWLRQDFLQNNLDPLILKYSELVEQGKTDAQPMLNTLLKLRSTFDVTAAQRATKRQGTLEDTADVQAKRGLAEATFESSQDAYRRTLARRAMRLKGAEIGQGLAAGQNQAVIDAYRASKANPELGLQFIKQSGLFQFAQGQEPVTTNPNYRTGRSVRVVKTGPDGTTKEESAPETKFALLGADGKPVLMEDGTPALFDKSRMEAATADGEWKAARWGMFNTKTAEYMTLDGEYGAGSKEAVHERDVLNQNILKHYGGSFDGALGRYVNEDPKAAKKSMDAKDLGEYLIFKLRMSANEATTVALQFAEAADQEGGSARALFARTYKPGTGGSAAAEADTPEALAHEQGIDTSGNPTMPSGESGSPTMPSGESGKAPSQIISRAIGAQFYKPKMFSAEWSKLRAGEMKKLHDDLNGNYPRLVPEGHKGAVLAFGSSMIEKSITLGDDDLAMRFLFQRAGITLPAAAQATTGPGSK